jgi:CheY-like chemotaxis protein
MRSVADGLTATGRRARILVVEDDADLGALMVGVLEYAGYASELVTSPDAAGGAGEPYDLIVADYLAPRYAPGAPWPHVERLRALGAGAPILGCTAHHDALADEPHALGVDAVTVKPFDLEDLLQTIERLLPQGPSRP